MHIGYIISSGIFYLSMCGDTICILQLLKNVYIYIYIYIYIYTLINMMSCQNMCICPTCTYVHIHVVCMNV